MDMAVRATILVQVAEWAEDQAEHLSTCEVRLNFTTNEVELYDWETGAVESCRPLSYFTD